MKRKILFVLCLLWALLIFYNSSNTGIESNELSFKIVGMVKNQYREISGRPATGIKDLPITKKESNVNLFLRKNAHALEFLVLSVLITLTFKSYGLNRRNVIIYSLLLCLLYANLDEFHQLFVIGRTSRVLDVLIDFMGSVVGSLIAFKRY